ncbi:MAG: hypothetical protein ACYTED_05865 [Planctomycetota bacterium]|jgi:hypothetical protein
MTKTTLALTMLLVLAGTSSGGASPTKIAAGEPPTIDGTLATEEWKDALHVELAPEGKAFLLQDDEALYVGLKVGQNCIPSLALLRGEKILVLHASASLGTAVYERSGEGWKATRTFAWRCPNGKTSAADRERFLADEGWFATTIGVGRKGEAEYRIERRMLAGKSPTLALVVCRLQPGTPTACVWPATVKDGTKDQALLFGRTPDLDFDPETWARLDMGTASQPADRFKAELDRVEAAAAKSPVEAYLALLDLLEENDDVQEGRDRAARLRRTLGDGRLKRDLSAG